MKTAIVVAFVCCFALALAEVGDKCNGNDECGEGECCVQMSVFLPAKCRKLKEKGQLCFPNEEVNKIDNAYRFMCPCKEGLVCKAEKLDEKEGTKIYVNAKCAEEGTTTDSS